MWEGGGWRYEIGVLEKLVKVRESQVYRREKNGAVEESKWQAMFRGRNLIKSVPSKLALVSSLEKCYLWAWILTSVMTTEHGEEGTAEQNPPRMNPQSPRGTRCHLDDGTNFFQCWLFGSAAQLVHAAAVGFRAQVSQLRSEQSVWMCICWESINAKGLLAVDDSYLSSQCSCLPTGLHFELQLCLGKKLNHNHILSC